MTPVWPLSAPATALLRSLRTSEGALLRLGIKHLVLVGAWRLETGPLPPKRFWRQPAREAHLYAGSGPVPPSLVRLDLALRAGLGSSRSTTARDVVDAGLTHDRGVVEGLRREGLQELFDAGLLRERPPRFGLSHRGDGSTLTPAGRAERARARSTHDAWKRDLRAGGERARAVVQAAGASPGLLLTAAPSLMAELDRELRRLPPARRSEAASGGDTGGGAPTSGDDGRDPDLSGSSDNVSDGLLDGWRGLTDGLKGLGDLDVGVSDGGGSGGWGGDGGGGDGGGGAAAAGVAAVTDRGDRGAGGGQAPRGAHAFAVSVA